MDSSKKAANNCYTPFSIINFISIFVSEVNNENMIDSISIKNYKNLSGLEVPHLAHVNLISGKNNIGKSSFLEAVGLHISDDMLFTIFDARGELYKSSPSRNDFDYETQNQNTFSSLFTGRNSKVSKDNEIKINDGNNSLSIRFVKYIEIDGDDLVSKKVVVLSGDEDSIDARIALELYRDDKNKVLLPVGRRYDRLRYTERLRREDIQRLVMVSPHNEYERMNPKFWDAITLTSKEEHVIRALQIIDSGIESLAYLEPYSYGDRYPVVKIKDSEGRVPLKSMGDGINHILSVILALVNCENGCVLIDEIDNGLHYTVQKKLWEIVFELSTMLNVQVFATTHSSDCISSFSKVLSNKTNQSIAKYIRLESKAGKIVANEYNCEELNIVAAQNIEIR